MTDKKQEDANIAESVFLEHWHWFSPLIQLIAHDYFVHGFKHGIENEGNRKEKDNG